MQNMTCLHMAAMDGGSDLVEVLLEGGADPNAKTSVRMTRSRFITIYRAKETLFSLSMHRMVLLRFIAQFSTARFQYRSCC